MGSTPYVDLPKGIFPTQGEALLRRVIVRFRNDPNSTIYMGVIIRDDVSPPYSTIIELDNGTVVTGGECIYTF